MSKNKNIMLISAASLMAFSYGAWYVYKYMSSKASRVANEVFKDTDTIINEMD